MAGAAFALMHGARLVHVPCAPADTEVTTAAMAALALRCQVGSAVVIAATHDRALRIGKLVGEAAENGRCGTARGVNCHVELREADNPRQFTTVRRNGLDGPSPQHVTVMSVEGWRTCINFGNLAIFEIPEPQRAPAADLDSGPHRNRMPRLLNGVTAAHILIVGTPSERTLRDYRTVAESRAQIFTSERSNDLPLEVLLAGPEPA